MRRDYKNYDYLSVSVKSEHLDKILSCYAALGWKERKREDDRQYSDMQYIAFVRPHKIENKDRLQYLQVRMESAINAMSKHYARKHSKSVFYGVALAVFTAAMVVLGLILMFVLGGRGGEIAGICCLAAAGAAVLIFTVPLCLLRRKENKRAQERVNRSLGMIEGFIKEAKTLSDGFPEIDMLGNAVDETEEYILLNRIEGGI